MFSPFITVITKSALTIGLILLFLNFSFSQNQNVSDSLKIVLKEHQGNDTIKLQLLYKIAQNERNPIKAVEYAEKLINSAESMNLPLYVYRGNLQKGQALREKGELPRAINFLFKAAKAAEDASYQAGVAGAYAALADVYSVNGNNKNAFQYYNRSIEILRKEQDSLTLATVLLNAGDGYLNAGKIDSAINYFEESGKIFQKADYLIGTAYNMGNMGMAHANKGDHQIAKNKMDSATAILQGMGDYYPIAVYDLYIADIYKKNNDLDRALAYAQHSLNISVEHSLKEQIKDANLKLSELYDDLNDYQKAFFHQKQYLIYRDSINNEEKIREIADLRTEYEVSQRETEIELLKTQQRNQYIIFASMAVIIILLGIASFLYYRNSRRKQTLNLILKERKEEAEAQRDQLEAINETREKFVSIIAHDLMGPVNSFKGLSTILGMSIEKEDKKDLKHIHSLFTTNINNLSTLLSNLLDWSVTQQGAIPYNPETLKLKIITDELLDLFYNTAEAKNIKLVAKIDPELMLWADNNSLKTILRNLVSNSLKFTKDSGSIKITAHKEDNLIVLTVSDTGIGMAKEQIQSLTEKYEFKRSQGTKGESGIGLGLQLVNEFVSMNKGQLKIESEINKGTIFTIYLPAIQGAETITPN